MKKKTLGIYSLLCVLVLWIFPEITAAFCTEFVALLKNHSHVHPGEASGDEDHHDAAPVDADACCLQIFAGGAGEFILTVSSLLVKPVLSGEVATSGGFPTLFLPDLLHTSENQSLLTSKSPPVAFKGPSMPSFRPI